MNLFNEIMQLVPRPNAPDPLSRSWDEVESEMSISFPDDFKTLISTYGSGVFNPSGFSLICYGYDHEILDHHLSYLSHHYRMMNDHKELNVFKNGRGLLPFARITAETVFFWEVDNSTSDWPIVCARDEGGRIDFISKTGLTATELMLRVFQCEDGDIFFSSIEELMTTNTTFFPQTFERRSDSLRRRLFSAVKKGMHQRVQDLIEWGADINADYGNEGQVLDIAVNYSDLEMVKILITNNATSTRRKTLEFLSQIETR